MSVTVGFGAKLGLGGLFFGMQTRWRQVFPLTDDAKGKIMEDRRGQGMDERAQREDVKC